MLLIIGVIEIFGLWIEKSTLYYGLPIQTDVNFLRVPLINKKKILPPREFSYFFLTEIPKIVCSLINFSLHISTIPP